MSNKTQAPAVIYIDQMDGSIRKASPVHLRYIRADIAEGLLWALEGLLNAPRDPSFADFQRAAQQAIRAAKEAGL